MDEQESPVSLTQSRLQEVLFYNQDTGLFYWRNRPPRSSIEPGQAAGCLDTQGYVRIVVDGKVCQGHNLAWLYMRGVYPKGRIDHKNRVKSDNRFDNLRIATPSQNRANSPSTSSSGYKNVYYDSTRRRYRARMKNPETQKNSHLGWYASAELAAAAVDVAAASYHGEFAFLNLTGNEANHV